MPGELRDSGIDVIGSVPWGTHFCQFYQTKQDLLEILVPYFKAGLENNEFCLWITSDPLTASEAEKAMREAVKDFDKYLRQGQIEIIPYDEWYLAGGKFNEERVLAGWVSKMEQALARGCSGLRLTGNTFWLEGDHWHAFAEYEAKVNDIIGKYNMLALCTYNLDRCNGAAVIDVVRNHQFALVKQKGKWDIIESAIYKQAQQALLESREDMNRAQAVAHTGSWRLDVRNNRLLWSDETHRIFGIPKGTPMTYETFLKSVHPDDREYVDRKWAAALRGEPYDIEHRIIVGGEVKWVRERAELEFDSLGSLKGGFGTVQDITELKQAEDKLRQAAREWRTTFDSITDLVSVHDRDFKILRVNKAFAKVLNMEVEEIIGKKCYEIVHCTDGPISLCPHTETMETGRPTTMQFFEPHLGIHLEVATSPIFNEAGEVTGSVHVARDITERKKLEQLKDDFIGLVSHELRSPMTVITGAINTLLTEEGRLSPEETRQLLKDAALEAELLSNILSNLLELSRVQANRLVLHTEAIDVKRIIQGVVEEIKHQSSAHQFVISIPRKLPPVYADPLRLERILYNLLENAIKYSPKGGKIRVSVKPEKEELVISVKDQGIGISPADQAKLFAPFQRLEEFRPEGTRGIGLGLLVCRRLVEAHGGRIWLKSSPGRGSTFFFTLPLKPKQP